MNIWVIIYVRYTLFVHVVCILSIAGFSMFNHRDQATRCGMVTREIMTYFSDVTIFCNISSSPDHSARARS